MPQNAAQTPVERPAASPSSIPALAVGDVVWWVGGAPCRPRRVRLVASTTRRDGGPGWTYQTVGGATGWQADDPAEHFVPLGTRKRNGDPR